jgi:integrase
MSNTGRMTGAKRLTDSAIRTWLQKPGSGKLHDGSDALHDGDGLYLRRRTGGAFWTLRQVNPMTRARTWAALFPDVPYPTASLAEARQKAAAARLQAADQQTDIVRDRQAALAKKRAAREAELAAQRRLTVRKLFEQWQRVELKPQILADGTRTGRKDGGQWVKESFERRLFGTLGDVPAADVSKADLLAILDQCKAEGRRRMANVLLTDLKQMFRFAADREIVARNPLDGVRRATIGGKDVERDRVLTADELRTLWAGMSAANMGKRSSAAVWLIVATACRVGEAMSAQWQHVDLVACTWLLPETKNQREHLVHLSAFAVRQFEALLALRERGPDGSLTPWVFPNARVGGPVDIKTFGKQLADRQRPLARRLKNRTKYTDSLVLAGGRWTAHDLRRTAATQMAGLGVSVDVIDECLNHKLQSKVARVYIKDRRLGEQARAFDALGNHLTALFGGASASNVVQLRAA